MWACCISLLLALSLAETEALSAGEAAECAPGQYAEEREKMVLEQIRARGIRDGQVLDAMRDVPRHCFVPRRLRADAYADHPLPIGSGQTISQPYIVALMTELLRVNPADRVLEIGTGSGYQAAVLSRLASRVFTVEIHPALAEEAGARLKALGYGNVAVRCGDGTLGWKEHAPFDAIIVTAAARDIPAPLVRQLKPGGRMCIPVGERLQVQSLVLIEKAQDGSVSKRSVLPVRFVPLLGGEESPADSPAGSP
jgi:protein-L-isoaspartate(D-aspartate) O-methyltransferase